MIKLLHKLGSLAEGITTTNSFDEVSRTLEKLRESGKKVSVTFQGDNTTYSTSVSAFNADHKIFVLNNFEPAAPAGSFRKGKVMTVIAGDKGNIISLESKYLEPLLENQSAGHQFQAPRRAQIVKEALDFGLLMGRLKTANASLANRECAEIR